MTVIEKRKNKILSSKTERLNKIINLQNTLNSVELEGNTRLITGVYSDVITGVLQEDKTEEHDNNTNNINNTTTSNNNTTTTTTTTINDTSNNTTINNHTIKENKIFNNQQTPQQQPKQQQNKTYFLLRNLLIILFAIYSKLFLFENDLIIGNIKFVFFIITKDCLSNIHYNRINFTFHFAIL